MLYHHKLHLSIQFDILRCVLHALRKLIISSGHVEYLVQGVRFEILRISDKG